MKKSLTSQIRNNLKKVIDPELGVNIVDLGLIYEIKSTENGKAEITMTLTSPGCPLAGVFDPMIRQALIGIDSFDPQNDLKIELTFDPPWVTDMMTEEVKAQLGFD